MQLALATFNVNGIRSIKDYYAQSKLNNNINFEEFLESFASDIICFQEHKSNSASKLSHDLSFPKAFAAFYAFPRIPKKIGYSGVVTFVKESSAWMPIAWYDGFSGLNDKIKVPLHESPSLRAEFSDSELAELDSEGRCLITDHFHFILLNIYFPNDSGPERSEFREKFYKAVYLRCRDLVRIHKKSLIILGDINIAYHPLDHCEYASAFKSKPLDIKAFLHNEELQQAALLKDFYSNPMRKWLASMLFSEDSETSDIRWKDCYRALNPFESNQDRYTCWNTQISARGTNYGTRIDTIYTCGPLFDQDGVNLKQCAILSKVMGSDHCPVSALFDFPPEFSDINENVLQDCKLKKGNIPRTFGNLNSFFTVSKKREFETIETAAETVEIVEDVINISHEPVKKSNPKISDYFKLTRTESISVAEEAVEAEETVETEEIDLKFVTDSQPSVSSLKDLFTKPQQGPLCSGHQEPCQLLKVKKAGPNRGRSFYVCARPGGASNDPQARCDFFEWTRKRNNE